MPHYYNDAGEPCHTQRTKKGAKYPTRSTRITDAITQMLFPSSTGVLAVMNQEWLIRHKAIEAVTYTLNNPAVVMPGDVDTYAAQTVDRLSAQSGEAAAIGTAMHDVLHCDFIGAKMPERIQLYDGASVSSGGLCAQVNPVMQGAGIDCDRSEFVTVNPAMGYAGTVDRAFTKRGKSGILDFKSKKTKEGKPIIKDPLHCAQIASYLASAFPEQPLANLWGANLYISTTEPGRMELHFWSSKELQESFDAFENMLALWRWKNNYDPRR